MLTTYTRLLQEKRAMGDDRIGRRRENRTLGCLLCGSVLGIFIAGEAPPEPEHDCPFERELYEADEIMEEIKGARGEDDE